MFQESRTDLLTNPMHVALNTLGEIIVDYFTNTLEIHTPGHDFRGDHDPALTPTHPTYGILTLFLAQTCVETVYIGRPT